MSDNHVKCFLAAARCRSLSRAAEYLFYTPQNLLSVSPTYSRMVYLQELEKEVKGGEA